MDYWQRVTDKHSMGTLTGPSCINDLSQDEEADSRPERLSNVSNATQLTVRRQGWGGGC